MFAGSSLWRNNFFINIGLCIGYLLYPNIGWPQLYGETDL